MPIESTPEEACTMLRFGAGDIGITDATKGEETPTLVFHPINPQAVGAMVDGIEVDKFSVGMAFPKPESIDALINHLVSFRASHFPESNPLAAG